MDAAGLRWFSDVIIQQFLLYQSPHSAAVVVVTSDSLRVQGVAERGRTPTALIKAAVLRLFLEACTLHCDKSISPLECFRGSSGEKGPVNKKHNVTPKLFDSLGLNIRNNNVLSESL